MTQNIGTTNATRPAKPTKSHEHLHQGGRRCGHQAGQPRLRAVLASAPIVCINESVNFFD
jgi:hypothetical protein